MKVAIGIDGSELSYQAVRFTSKLLSPRVDDLLLFLKLCELACHSDGRGVTRRGRGGLFRVRRGGVCQPIEAG